MSTNSSHQYLKINIYVKKYISVHIHIAINTYPFTLLDE
jgi:hypothetical protein